MLLYLQAAYISVYFIWRFVVSCSDSWIPFALVLAVVSSFSDSYHVNLNDWRVSASSSMEYMGLTIARGLVE